MDKWQVDRLECLLCPVAYNEVSDAARLVVESIPDMDRAKFLELCRGVTDNPKPFEFSKNRTLAGFVVGPILPELKVDHRSAYIFLDGLKLGGKGKLERLSCVAHEIAHVVLEHPYQTKTFGEDDELRHYQARKLEETLERWKFAAVDTPKVKISLQDFAGIVQLNVGRCTNYLPIPPRSPDDAECAICLFELIKEIEEMVNDEHFTEGEKHERDRSTSR